MTERRILEIIKETSDELYNSCNDKIEEISNLIEQGDYKKAQILEYDVRKECNKLECIRDLLIKIYTEGGL